MNSTEVNSLKKLNFNFVFLCISIIFLFSCAGTKTIEPTGPDILYNQAMEKFKKEDYQASKNLFEAFLFSYPANKLADQAQFYLAETHYKRDEFIIAAFSYNSLAAKYTSSPLVSTAQFKAAECYYRLSPKFDRDQEYTVKAIDALKSFRLMYSNDSLTRKADSLISILRNKLAQREFTTAELYIKLDEPKSALVYYQSIINDYTDTNFFENSFYGKIQVLLTLRRYDELKSMIATYPRVFPQGKYNKEIEDISNKVINIH
ncbi:MAG: outer membrane protein assembly factor BamD [Candidatus Kapabacteria bacterium]|nr:outer membrane protein assembly factor BamD [Candidatus Kapabacteria bacterium]